MAKLCARGKAAAKRKFDVYPSAYANMYASAVCSGKVTPGGKKGKANGGMLSAGATLDKRKKVITKNKTNLSQQRKSVSSYEQGGIAKGCGDVINNRRKVTKKY
jgi:hypothetical protein